MADCVLKISKDKAFFKAETPDANWGVEQISADGLNILFDEETPTEPMYLVVSEDYEGTDGLKRNCIYALIPLVTEVVPNSDLDEEKADDKA